MLRPNAIPLMSPRVLLESSRGQFWENCRNRVRGRFWRNRQTFPRDVSSTPAKPDVATCPTSHQNTLRLGRLRRIPAVGFSRATNKLHVVPPWPQEWIPTQPSSGPSIWAILLHRTVVRSGLQCHHKVSRLRMATRKIRDTTLTIFIQGPSIVLPVWKCIMFNGSYLRMNH